MPHCQYILTHSLSSWQQTLTRMASHLPEGVHPQSVQALKFLPVFALVVVVRNDTLPIVYEHAKHLDELVASWGQDNGWVIEAVPTESNYSHVFAPKEVSSISDVSVFRYVIMPKNPKQITAEKRDVAAHIADEQLTAYLRKKLKPKPTYDFKVDGFGQIDNFTFGAKKAPQYLDCHILSIAQMLRRHKLACFDMDSTLIKQEVIDELGKIAGVGEKMNQITEAAMRGEIDFTKSFVDRVALLQGLDTQVIDQIKSGLIPQSGAFITINALKSMGYHVALISGGFTPFAQYICALLGIDEYHANTLDVADGQLSGMVVPPIIDGKQKAKIVAKIADKLSIDLDEVICIGDGANDLPMMAISDLGVAYRAKPIVQVRADAAINVTGLEGVLYALGYPALTLKEA